tara:strand:+ start:831 stop:4577 length:3747 start_codon:yes stop_codon:yes gene_type:complete
MITNYDDIILFLKKYWRNNHPFTDKYILKKFLKYDNSIYIYENNLITSIYLSNEINYIYKNKEFKCNECSILKSINSDNNLSIILKMLNSANSCLSVGVNRKTFYPICKQLGYITKDMNRYCIFIKNEAIDFIKYFKKNINENFNIYEIGDKYELPHNDFKDIINFYYNFIKNNNFCAVNKDYEYFKYKYFESPFFNYKIIGNKKIGFIIFRIEQIELNTFKKYNVLRIIEILYDLNKIKEFKNVICELLNYSYSKNCILGDFYFSNDFYDNLLLDLGFYKNINFVPYLFREHNIKNIENLNFAFYSKNNETIEDLYIVKSNIDQDIIYNKINLKIKITDNNQLDFCKLSGDYNALHYKKIQENYCFFKIWNCHGINIVLTVLNIVFSHLNLFDIFINNISVKYFKELNVNYEYDIKFNQKFNKLEIYVIKNENNMVYINIEFKIKKIINIDISNNIFEYDIPNNIKREEITNFKKCIKLELNKNLYKMIYPFLYKNFINYQIASIIIISRIIGMIVPGKYSLCNSFDLQFRDINNINNINDIIDININTFNNDLSLIDINLKSNFCDGKINCLYLDEICSINLKKIFNNKKIINKKNKISILSSINIDTIKDKLYKNISKYINNIDIYTYEYGQLQKNLIFEDSELYKHNPEYIFIIDRPEDIINKSLDEYIEKDNIKIDEYFNSIKTYIKNNSNITIFIMEYFLTEKSINFNCINNKILNKFQEKLNLLKNEYKENINILKVQNIIDEEILDKRMWYLGKIPYKDNFINKLACKISGLILSIKGLTARLLVLDLDNTLWGGVVGEDGIYGIKIGEDYPGNIFKEFQKKIKLLKERGIALAICSKNDINIVNEVFEKNKNMILKKEDFLYIYANWDNKFENIKLISENIGLGFKNILFIDDNPIEREQVKKFLPDVNVLELSKDPIDYIDNLLNSPLLEIHKLTESDKKRVKTYETKIKLNNLEKKYINKEDFYKQLNLEIYINNLDNSNKDRCIQLINKTNQFNSTTLRLNESELSKYKIYILGAKDKFNDYENMGVLITTEKDTFIEINNYLLSCRFLGKNLENEFIKWLLNYGKKNNFKKIIGKIIETDRNEPVRNIYKNNNFILQNDLFIYDLKNENIKMKEYIKLYDNTNNKIELNLKNTNIMKKDIIYNYVNINNINNNLIKIIENIIDIDSIEIFNELIENNKLNDNINYIPSWSSLKHIILINKLEKKFEIKFRIDEIIQIKTISLLNEYIILKCNIKM